MIFVLACTSLRISDRICAVKARALGHALRAMHSRNNNSKCTNVRRYEQFVWRQRLNIMEKRMVNAMGDDDCCRLKVRKLAFLILNADGAMNLESTELLGK